MNSTQRMARKYARATKYLDKPVCEHCGGTTIHATACPNHPQYHPHVEAPTVEPQITCVHNNEFIAQCRACGAQRRALDGPAGPQRRQELYDVRVGRSAGITFSEVTLCPSCLQVLSQAIFPSPERHVSARRDRLAGDEAEACGLWLGGSNLALLDRSSNGRQGVALLAAAPNWPQVCARLRGVLGSYAEDDKQFEGMLRECRSWQRQAKQGDAWVVGEWRNDLARAAALQGAQ